MTAAIRRLRWAIPYLFLVPGGLWLLIFFVVPMAVMASISLQTGSLGTGYALTWNFGIYPEAISQFATQFLRSFEYGIIVTILTLLIGYPMAYTIAFRGGRLKNILLLLVILPFFTSFIIRTLAWKLILADNGFLLGTLKGWGLLPDSFGLIATPISVISGLVYNFLPFMVLPLYVALEKIDPRLIEAANDLYASRWGAFRRVTFPLALPGVFAGSILTFIPALGDWVNAELLGNTQTKMIGNVIQDRFISQGDYPVAAALSFLLMAGILVAVSVYGRFLGTERLTG